MDTSSKSDLDLAIEYANGRYGRLEDRDNHPWIAFLSAGLAIGAAENFGAYAWTIPFLFAGVLLWENVSITRKWQAAMRYKLDQLTSEKI